eukprot:13404932-Alexandrium_andersonii.AAC.1
MEFHIRFAVPRGDAEPQAEARAAERQDFPADRAALDAAGYPEAEARGRAGGATAKLRPGLL